MPVNRLSHVLAENNPPAATESQGTIPAGFALCPVFVIPFQALQQFPQWQEVYRQAYLAALAHAWRARLERRFFSVWN